jgi:hypothetical protein
MKSVEETYGKRFFARRDSLSWRVPLVCNAVIATYEPKSLIDVGCAIGDYVLGFQERDVLAEGIEGSSESMEFWKTNKISIVDMRKRYKSITKFDLAMCLEVAEHIEKEFVDIFLQNLISLSSKIMMSAAPPGQKGHGHVNCQPRHYWVEKMYELGYEEDLGKEYILLSLWKEWKHRKEMSAYYNNLVCFKEV